MSILLRENHVNKRPDNEETMCSWQMGSDVSRTEYVDEHFGHVITTGGIKKESTFEERKKWNIKTVTVSVARNKRDRVVNNKVEKDDRLLDKTTFCVLLTLVAGYRPFWR